MTDIQQLVEQLNSKDVKTRDKAQNALIALGATAVDPLINLLYTADWNNRMRAYETILDVLASTKDPRIIPVFIQELRRTELHVYNVARDAFTAMGDTVIDPMLEVLNDPNDKANYAVINLTGVIKNPRFIPPLLAKLRDPAPMIRYRAAHALAELREQSAVTTLQQMALTTNDRDERRELLRALGKFGQRAWVIEFAGRILLNDDYTNEDHQSVVQIVATLNDPAAGDLLLRVLKKQEYAVSIVALGGLDKLKYAPAVDYLIELLNHSDPIMRGLAAHALGEIGDKRAVKPLKSLSRDKALSREISPNWEQYPGLVAEKTVSQIAREALAKLEPSPGWKFW